MNAALLALLLSAVAPPPSELRVTLIRHAEVASEPADNPGLSEAGQARVACIGKLLADEKLTHVLASPWRRTQETAGALAAGHDLEVLSRDPMALTAMVEELRALPPGSSVLVVGHSNTLPALVEALGGKLEGLVEERGQPALPRDEFDRVVRLRLRTGEGDGPRLLALEDARQGCAPSPR
jgi:broad specificity phosphatase PhoE